MKKLLMATLVIVILMATGCSPRKVAESASMARGYLQKFDPSMLYEFYESGNYEEAYKVVSEYLKTDPYDFIALNEKAYILMKMGKNEEAILLMDKLLKNHPRDKILLSNKSLACNNLGLYQMGLETVEKSLKIGDTDEYEYQNKAFALYGLGRYKEVVEYYDLALSRENDLAYAYYGRGKCLEKQNKYDDALYSFKKAYELEQENLYFLGVINCLNHLKRYDDMLLCCEDRIKKDPEDADAYFYMATAYGYLNQIQEALKYYNKAIMYTGYRANIWYEKCKLYIKLKDKDNAYRCLEMAINEDPFYINVINIYDLRAIWGYKRFGSLVLGKEME